MLDIKIDGEVKSLLKKMLEVINEVENIPKSGYNPTVGYNYVLERDVVNTLRKSLTNKGIIVMPSIIQTSERAVPLENGSLTTISKVMMSYTFFDTQTGGSITTYGAGEGQDNLDKGIYKAITGCQKYVLLKTFMIPTGDDPEYDEGSKPNQWQLEKDNKPKLEPDDKVSVDIAKQVYAIGQKKKGKLTKILDKYGYKTTYDIQYKNLAAINKELAS